MRSLRFSLRGLRTHTAGNVAVLFALTLLPLMTAVGVAIDFARAAGAREELQSALDAAVLAGVRQEESDERASLAAAMFDRQTPKTGTAIVSSDFQASGDELAGSVVGTVPTAMLGILRIDHLTVRAESRAAVSGARVCILVNNPGASQALLVNSGVHILAPDCEMHVRSSAATAAMINDGIGINMQRVCIKSNSVTENGAKNAAVEKGCDAIDNPFAGRLPRVAVPHFPSNDCSTTNGRSYDGRNNAVAVSEGNHCGLNFNGTHASITLGKGKYKWVNLGNAATVSLGGGSYEGVNINSGVKTLNLAAGYYKNLTLNSGETVNLNPGTFENLTINSGPKTINMAPGLYIWKGQTTLNSARLAGDGVTIYYPDRDSFIRVNSGAALDISAPTSGAYSGILMFEPDGLASSTFTINGSSKQELDGLLYWPSRHVTFNSTTTILSDRISLVVDKMTLNAIDWRFEAAAKGMSASAGGVARLTK